MAGTVKQANLSTPTARTRLKRGRQPHWRTITTGRAHLGYQRWDADSGRWILRRYQAGKYSREPLGLADDKLPADGDGVLSFEQAEAAARAMLNRPQSAPARLTVRQAMKRYIEIKHAQGQSTSDLQSRSAAYILPALGSVVVSELTSAQIAKWLATMAAMPAVKRTKDGAPQAYKPEPEGGEAVRRRRASANRVLTMFKAALNHAYDEGLVPSNEAWGRRVKPFRSVEVARVRYLTVTEAQRLINASDPDFRSLVQAALETGARYGEIIRLEVADFNPDVGTIAIRQSKSGKARHVVLTGEGAAFFRQVCAGRDGQKLMFLRADGQPWKSSQQGRPMREACERANIDPPITFHGLRHTWASLSVMAGMPLLVVAKNLGHANTRMVEKHYGHLADSYVVETIRDRAPRFGFQPDEKITTLR